MTLDQAAHIDARIEAPTQLPLLATAAAVERPYVLSWRRLPDVTHYEEGVARRREARGCLPFRRAPSTIGPLHAGL